MEYFLSEYTKPTAEAFSAGSRAWCPVSPLERPYKHSAQRMKIEPYHIIQCQNTVSNGKNLQASPDKERKSINEKFKE